MKVFSSFHGGMEHGPLVRGHVCHDLFHGGFVRLSVFANRVETRGGKGAPNLCPFAAHRSRAGCLLQQHPSSAVRAAVVCNGRDGAIKVPFGIPPLTSSAAVAVVFVVAFAGGMFAPQEGHLLVGESRTDDVYRTGCDGCTDTHAIRVVRGFKLRDGRDAGRHTGLTVFAATMEIPGPFLVLVLVLVLLLVLALALLLLRAKPVVAGFHHFVQDVLFLCGKAVSVVREVLVCRSGVFSAAAGPRRRGGSDTLDFAILHG